MQVNIYEAKSKLSQYLKDVENGGTVTICRNGTPIAELVPVAKKKPFVFGALAHLLPPGVTSVGPVPPTDLAEWGEDWDEEEVRARMRARGRDDTV